MKYQAKTREKGVALVMVMMIAGLVSIVIGGFVFSIASQGSFNRHSYKHDRALWMAETGIQRMMSGLKYQNDKVGWMMSMAIPDPRPAGYWLSEWKDVKDENGTVIGKYWVEFLSKTNKQMRLKVVGKTFDRIDAGVMKGEKTRTIGVELTRFTLGDFAIASNHQIGGVHINGGAKIHGGVFTSGRLHLDSNSTGVYNDYNGLATDFAGMPVPTEAPDSEIFTFKDTVTAPSPDPNGVIDTNTDEVGTSDNPLKAIHTEETAATGDTDGDGVIGNKAGNIHVTKKDHKMPQVNFPDASAGSQYMEDRKAEAAPCVYTGNVSLNGSGNVTLPGCSGSAGDPASRFYFDDATNILTVNQGVYIIGNFGVNGPVTWQGKGAVFVQGDSEIRESFLPQTPADFPLNAAVGVVATGNLDINEGTGTSGKAAGFFFGNNSMSIHKMKIYGNIFGQQVNMPTTGTRPDIYVHPDLMDSTGVPMPDFTNAFVKKTNWWEMTGTAAKAPN